MSDLRPGEVVDVTIKGVRIARPRSATSVTITDEHGTAYQMPPQAAIERVAPAEWPPQAGDLWAGPKNERWFAAMYLGDPDDPKDWEGCNSEGWRVVLVPLEVGPYGGSEERPDDALRTRGPLTLVYREGRRAAVVQAKHLSCQGLQMVDPDQPMHGGLPVEGFQQELERRGEDHVYGCELIGCSGMTGGTQ